MKYFKNLLSILSIVILFNSCTRYSHDDQTTPDLYAFSALEKITVEDHNGILSFNNLNDFYLALESLSDSEDYIMSDKILNQWESKLNFRSLRKVQNEIYNKYESALSLDDIISLSTENSEIVYFENNTLYNIVGNSLLSCILNENSLVIVDDQYHFYNDKFQIILEKDKITLLPEVLRLPYSEYEGITVNTLDTQISRMCEDFIEDEDIAGNKKIEGEWRTWLTASPVTGSFDGWTWAGGYDAEMRSYKRNWLGVWVKNHDDDISWSCGYTMEASGDFPFITLSTSNGTGWTQNSWKFDYRRAHWNHDVPVNLEFLPSSVSFTKHAYNHANISVSGLATSGFCQE